MPKVFKSQLIEVIQPANSTATKIQFQDFPYLRGRQIYGIETMTTNDMTYSPTGKVLPTTAQSKLAFTTLYLDDLNKGAKNVGEWIQSVPFSMLHRIQNSSTDPFVRQMFELTGQIVYWEKCYITLSGWTSFPQDVSFSYNVYFK